MLTFNSVEGRAVKKQKQRNVYGKKKEFVLEKDGREIREIESTLWLKWRNTDIDSILFIEKSKFLFKKEKQTTSVQSPIVQIVFENQSS